MCHNSYKTFQLFKRPDRSGSFRVRNSTTCVDEVISEFAVGGYDSRYGLLVFGEKGRRWVLMFNPLLGVYTLSNSCLGFCGFK